MEDDLKIKKQIEGSNQSPKRCLHAKNQVLEMKNKKVIDKGVDYYITGHPLAGDTPTLAYLGIFNC